ncbi:hypothetical protein A7982_13819 [Minicystis rosea]|nr:hypothetical protein A7982_13819 [Minicystis rosea]
MRMMILADPQKPDPKKPGKTRPATGRVDRTGMVTGFLGESIKGDRFKTGTASPQAYSSFPQLGKSKDQYYQSLSTTLKEHFREEVNTHRLEDLFFGTKFVAQHFKSNPESSRQTVQEGWETKGQAFDARRDEIEDFLAEKGLPKDDEQKNIVVLWSRFTGKTGGAHMEYDTSFTGLRQLVKLAQETNNDYVIIAGDKPKSSETGFDEAKKARRKDKISDIASDASTASDTGFKVINLTEFWNDDGWERRHFSKRIDQFKVFEALHRKHKVKHLGARSGNLESLAALGYTVRYFEDVYGEGDEALDKKRMEAWHDTVDYRRIQIQKVPTRSGQYVINGVNKNPYPGWHYGARKLGPPSRTVSKHVVKPDVADYSKGFLPEDLAEFERYFSIPRTAWE